jgi:hypothetical protein
MATHRDHPHLCGWAIADKTQRHINGCVFGGRITDRAHAIAMFHANTRDVKAVSPERLLVFGVKEGWEPLCAFIGVAVPDTPSPARQRHAAIQRSGVEEPLDATPQPSRARRPRPLPWVSR